MIPDIPVTTAEPVTAVEASPEASSSSSNDTPQSTADIAASVIADMESAGTSDKAEGNATQVVAPVPVADEDDFDAVPAETMDSRGKKKPNNIPHPRVKQMIEKREQKLIATVAKELGITKAEAELKLEDVLGDVRVRGSKLTEAELRLSNIKVTENVMIHKPAQFMELLISLNPEYGNYKLTPAEKATALAPHETLAKAEAIDEPEPEPDFDLGNGQKTYSLDGIRKLRAWERRQTETNLERKLGERLKPFEEQRRQDQERETFQKQQRENNDRLVKRVDRARKWPQFTEHETDILAHMDAEKGKGNFVSFEDAYMHIVPPKLAGDRTRIRQEVLAEINAQPKTSSVTKVEAPMASAKPKTTADYARELIAQLDK